MRNWSLGFRMGKMKKAAEVRDLGGFSAQKREKSALGPALLQGEHGHRHGQGLAPRGIADGVRFEEHRGRVFNSLVHVCQVTASLSVS
jgi:hypothetical protein